MAPISHCEVFHNHWDRINVTTRKKSSSEQSLFLHYQIHGIINAKYLKKEREKNLTFSQE